MTRLNWEDIAGGVKGSPAPAGQAEILPELPVGGGGEGQGFSLAGANAWLEEALQFVQKIDQFVGIFTALKAPAGGTVLEMLPQDAPVRELPAAKVKVVDAPSPVPAAEISGSPTQGAAPGEAQVLGLMKKILAGEGDIPLSQLLAGIEHQEPWLLRYALEMMAK